MQMPFEQAVQRHGATVWRVCRAVLGADADADDAWSETFLAALVAWPSLAEDTNVEAWLVRVAHRKAIDVARARSRRAVPVDDVAAHAAPVAAPDGTGIDVWRALAALPRRQRLAVAYHHLGGLRHAETAQLIGGSEAAVRRAAADGIRNLRRALGEEGTP